MDVCILNSGGQPDYIYGLMSGFACRPEDHVDLVGIAEFTVPGANIQLHVTGRDRRYYRAKMRKGIALIKAYVLTVSAIVKSKAPVLHVQWAIRFEVADYIFLILLCKLLRKRMILTVHDVDALARSGEVSRPRKTMLKIIYVLCDHLIVHTQSGRNELITEFGVKPESISIVPHGINNYVRISGMTKGEARSRCSIPADAKIILFFGKITSYKGLPDLADALDILEAQVEKAHFILAGHPANEEIEKWINEWCQKSRIGAEATVILKHVPKEDIETLFSAADCLVLPYRGITQSGLPFLSYRFGLPIIATTVGGLPEVVLEGFSGKLCKPNDPQSLASAIVSFFHSSLYENAEETKRRIQEWSEEVYSWRKIADLTASTYEKVLMR